MEGGININQDWTRHFRPVINANRYLLELRAINYYLTFLKEIREKFRVDDCDLVDEFDTDETFKMDPSTLTDVNL